jgi:hypothetical protein
MGTVYVHWWLACLSITVTLSASNGAFPRILIIKRLFRRLNNGNGIRALVACLLEHYRYPICLLEGVVIDFTILKQHVIDLNKKRSEIIFVQY